MHITQTSLNKCNWQIDLTWESWIYDSTNLITCMNESSNVPVQCFARTNATKTNFQKWKMLKILLQIFMLGRQQKGLQRIIQMCSWLPLVGDCWISVADCQYLKIWGSLQRLLGESLWKSFESGQNLLVSGFWKLFLKILRQGKSKRKLWGLDWGPAGTLFQWWWWWCVCVYVPVREHMWLRCCIIGSPSRCFLMVELGTGAAMVFDFVNVRADAPSLDYSFQGQDESEHPSLVLNHCMRVCSGSSALLLSSDSSVFAAWLRSLFSSSSQLCTNASSSCQYHILIVLLPFALLFLFSTSVTAQFRLDACFYALVLRCFRRNPPESVYSPPTILSLFLLENFG